MSNATVSSGLSQSQIQALIDSSTHPDDDVESVTGSSVDNTDPRNPVISFTPQTYTAQTAPLYEYRDLWAEESEGTNDNASEWSYGNGATGSIGIPMPAGWELIELGFQADGFPSGSDLTFSCVEMINSGAGTVIGSMTISSPTDGGGGIDHAFKVEAITGATPLSQTTVVGFVTNGENGAIIDARVSARFRRQIGSYVTGITLN